MPHCRSVCYIVDLSNRPLRVVTLGEVLRFVLCGAVTVSRIAVEPPSQEVRGAEGAGKVCPLLLPRRVACGHPLTHALLNRVPSGRLCPPAPTGIPRSLRAAAAATALPR